MTKQIWLNLPVKDVAKSKSFFSKIGFSFNEQHDTPSSTCMLVGDREFVIMLFEESLFATFSQNKLTDTQLSSEVLISIDAESREEVDQLTVKVKEAGGIIFSKPSESEGWMYGSAFADLDGHRWNILFMDSSKMPKQKSDKETLEFKIRIKAPAETVWSVLWNDETYRKWAGVFYEGSYAASDWNEGGKIHFLGSDGGGMYSIIEKKIQNEYMAFKHLGEVKAYRELPIDEKAQEWSGAMESYRLSSDGEFTDIVVQVDAVEKFIEYIKDAFPRALEMIKELSEQRK